MLNVGDTAPAFSLPDQSGKIHNLKDYHGKWVFLYFYPKDETPGCTKEACSFRDNWAELKKFPIQLFGVSGDSVESHRKFAQHHELPFPLLSDPEKKMMETYGAIGEKSMFGKKYRGILRSSVLINPQGKVAKVYPKVNVKTHVQQVLKDVDQLITAA